MINQDRVREMTRMAMLENGPGERELKISTYRRSDYVILQMVKGFVLGTICFLAVLVDEKDVDKAMRAAHDKFIED